MNIRQKRDFLVQAAYWAFIIGIVYLILQYLVPIVVPFILGFLVAYAIVKLSDRFRYHNIWVRLLMVAVFYGTIGLLIGLLAIKAFSMATSFVMYLPNLYEHKLSPAIDVFYQWLTTTVAELDPSLKSAVSVLGESLITALRNLFTSFSGYTVDFVSRMVTGVPSLVLSTLAMIISTVFVVVDYERMRRFASVNVPVKWKNMFKVVKHYLTDTLLVVIRSYALIMLLTGTELSILFTIFGIGDPILKACIIAVFDIMPILGTGGIMIPWAVISLIIGNTALGIKLFVIYGIVTVVRNYVEPKIVGAQLGLHPIITLVSMFVGLRLFGFFGLFGCPVAISFFWKSRKEKLEEAQKETAKAEGQQTDVSEKIVFSESRTEKEYEEDSR